jgi:CheY-like chemotaxis protein
VSLPPLRKILVVDHARETRSIVGFALGNLKPVVFFTSHLSPEDLEHYRSLGAIGTIAKPFNPLHVVRKLKEMWRLHHTRVPAA